MIQSLPSITQARERSSTDSSMVDSFSDPRLAGQVIGTLATSGAARKGIDHEGVISIDNGALRIEPLISPRWGRAGIGYGPFPRQNGLAFGAFVLNGHNTSQSEPLPEKLRTRFERWALGSETEKPWTRLLRWMRGRQKRHMWRRALQWIRSGSRFLRVSPLDENLAVGWFPAEAPANPREQGNSFIMHALGPECGGLWTRVGSACPQAIRGLQNVPVHYIIVLRERGAAYYAASIPGVPGLDAYPEMRLLAIDAFNSDPSVYAGIHQSVLGQIGFRVDTRVYRTQVATLPEFDQWYGSAQGADALTGQGPLHLSDAEIGGCWMVGEGEFERTDAGLVAGDTTSAAVLKLDSTSGLVHLLIRTADKPIRPVSVIWRYKDDDNFWSFEVGSQQCQLSIKENGVSCRFPGTRAHYLAPNVLNAVQVSDDGESIRLYLNGELVYGTCFTDTRLQEAPGAGIRVSADGDDRDNPWLQAFEAHPRSVRVPEAFDLGNPWYVEGNRVVASDDFNCPPGDLTGRTTPVGARVWRKTIGLGVFEIAGHAAKVVGSVQKPCPGRTAYTIPWNEPDFADVQVRITPPGVQRGKQERGRGGLIFWQDPNNYITLTVFVDDWYGTSIAAFFYLDGYEELFDAVWTNVGKRIHWGVAYDFRVVFDGKRFLAFVNGEPVLYRALSDVYRDWDRLAIKHVGIVANWEWGNDTGSTFQNFVAKDRA